MTEKKANKASNTTVITAGYVPPNEPSSTQLGEGIYSLNKRSNVPFIQLVGSAGYRKTISWGELCEVPCGQVVTVWNASYHGGDIFINKGPDMCNRPSRISVPVPFEFKQVQTGEGLQTLWSTVFPCDTRAAKRAFLNVDAVTNNPDSNNGNQTVFVRGRRLNGSMQCENSLQYFDPPWGPGVGYLNGLIYPIQTELVYIPLGQGASEGDDTRPHNLLDASDVFFLLGFDNDLTEFFTWPADSDIFGFPTGQAPAPGTWYIIEYD